MTFHSYFPSPPNAFPASPIYLAQEDDQNLEFDDTFDDDEFDTGGKPPNKRPYFIIVAIVLIGALVYFALDLQLFSSLGNMIVSPSPTMETKTPPQNTVATPAPRQFTNTPKIAEPRFSEGQVVSLVIPPSSTSPVIHLKTSPAGLKQGAAVHGGEKLTVLDGTFINNRWLYQVKAQSGSTGWIEERYLKAAA